MTQRHDHDSVFGEDELMTLVEVAEVLRVPQATLRYWRYLGTGPGSFKIGRHVRYRRVDVVTWLRDQRLADGPDAA
jgi:DNA-binding transcriptional MerR regulator